MRWKRECPTSLGYSLPRWVHRLSSYVFEHILPYFVLSVKGIIYSFYLSEMLRFLIWWSSPITNLGNSLCHCGLRRRETNACAQFTIMNWKCLLIFFEIILSCFLYLSIPHWDFLVFFFTRFYFIYLHVVKKSTTGILNRIIVICRVIWRKWPLHNVQSTHPGTWDFYIY